MNITDVIRAMNQRLYDELVALSDKAKDIYLNGTAGTDEFLGYQIILPDDNEVRFNIVVGSDAPHSAAPYATLDDAMITTFIHLHSRKGKASFIHGYNTTAKDNISLKTDGGANLDDMIPWIWLADTEQERLVTDGDFPTTGVVGIAKEIIYTFDQMPSVTVATGNTIQVALDPAVLNTAPFANTWVSDNPNIATISQWVQGGSLGGLITGVAAGETYIRNSLSKEKLLVIVT